MTHDHDQARELMSPELSNVASEDANQKAEISRLFGTIEGMQRTLAILIAAENERTNAMIAQHMTEQVSALANNLTRTLRCESEGNNAALAQHVTEQNSVLAENVTRALRNESEGNNAALAQHVTEQASALANNLTRALRCESESNNAALAQHVTEQISVLADNLVRALRNESEGNNSTLARHVTEQISAMTREIAGALRQENDALFRVLFKDDLPLPIHKYRDPTLPSFCIDLRYRHRTAETYWDDTAFTDEWQREVYAYAANVMADNKLKTVYDVGCGSGYKLIRYLGDFDTTGLELESTVRFLRSRYSDSKWIVFDYDLVLPPADLVICADVIEHVLDPNKLIGTITKLAKRFVILSTPDRELLYNSGDANLMGPPANLTHVREWNFAEFCNYIARYFRILEHKITNVEQGTQMIFCSPLAGSQPCIPKKSDD